MDSSSAQPEGVSCVLVLPPASVEQKSNGQLRVVLGIDPIGASADVAERTKQLVGGDLSRDLARVTRTGVEVSEHRHETIEEQCMQGGEAVGVVAGCGGETVLGSPESPRTGAPTDSARRMVTPPS